MTIEELYEAILRCGVRKDFGLEGENFQIEQHPQELAEFLHAMQELGVQSVLEIGTGYKGGFSRFLASELGWEVWTVDVKNYGHQFPGVMYVVLGHPDDTFISRIVATGSRKFDLVFIDGAHDIGSVQNDLKLYDGLAEKVIAIHDIAGQRDCEGARDVWRELAYTKAGKLRKGFYESIAEADNRAGVGWQVL